MKSEDLQTMNGPRKLAGRLDADIVDYSHWTGFDENGALHRLLDHDWERKARLTASRYGRIVTTTGDGFVIEFASIVAADRCAFVMERGEFFQSERNSKNCQNPVAETQTLKNVSQKARACRIRIDRAGTAESPMVCKRGITVGASIT